MRGLISAGSVLGTIVVFGAIPICLYAQTTTVDDTTVKDSISSPIQSDNCTLTWAPVAPNTRTQVLRRGTAHVTYVSGRYRWTCGTATMVADSTEKYDARHQIELIGNVVYTDSIRTLRSDFLTYHEIEDLVEARNKVELVRFLDGSKLVGPRVRFLRAVTSVDAQTVATGRPHMTFYPEDPGDEEPFEVDADQAEFGGENEARFYGDVILERTDVLAEADSAFLSREDGWAVMWGSPQIETKEISLKGDTIRFYSQDEDLKKVNVIGTAFASSDQFQVRSELVDIELEEEEVQQVWSHGEGFSDALSGDHLLIGDSLHFVMFEKQIDSVVAVGGALAIQGDSAGLAAELSSVQMMAGQMFVDSVRREEEKPPDEVRGRTEMDSTENTSDLIDEKADFLQKPATRILPPQPSIDGSTDWVRGDTLIAVFERFNRSLSEPLTVVEDGAPPDSVSAALDEVSEDLVGTGKEVPDAVDDPAMERLVAIGQASSFYRQVRDSTLTDQPSRNYMVGTRIDVFFEDGEPVTVRGENAVGIYLEPEEAVVQPGADTLSITRSPVSREWSRTGRVGGMKTYGSSGMWKTGSGSTGTRGWVTRLTNLSGQIAMRHLTRRARSHGQRKL